MKKAIMLSGVPGVGKSTNAKRYFEQGYTIISSDEIRLNIFGTLDASVQTVDRTNAVFNKMRKLAAEATGNIVWDSVNLTRKARLNRYAYLKSLGFQVEIIQYVEPLSIILERNANREPLRVVPTKVVINMYKDLQPPKIGVDCDSFSIVSTTPFLKGGSLTYLLDTLKTNTFLETINKVVSEQYLLELKLLNNSHDTPYHLETIDEHISMCIKNSKNNIAMKIISFFHDLGKSVAKDGGKYHGHENVSAMYLANVLSKDSTISKDEANVLLDTVLYHMLSHSGISQKVINKYKLIKETLNHLEDFHTIDSISRITKEDYEPNN